MMITLTVKLMSGEVRSLEVNGDATVGELKRLISPLFDLPPYSQKLFAENGHRINLEDDSRSLSSYGLQSGSLLNLIVQRFQVFVKNEAGVTGTYDVEANETVDQLRAKISRKERGPDEQYRLIYGTKELQSGMKLQDYNIKPKSTIFKVLRLRGG